MDSKPSPSHGFRGDPDPLTVNPPCPSGKLGHETAEGARGQLASMKRAGRCRDPNDMAAYRCPRCSRWHVGHRIGCAKRRATG